MSFASWQTYQNDLRNTGNSSGTGYFPLKTSNFSIGLGMDFQPLVDDLDLDGNNEIALFSNESLIILNPQLEKLSEIKIGAILGQPTLFNFDDDDFIEIVFNSRQNLDYFSVYQYNNSNLQQEFNITLSNDANFSGIKCFYGNSLNYCVFKDKLNNANIINLEARNVNSYNLVSLNESRQTVTAIGDIDNDGNIDAVFWIPSTDGNNYGLAAFDLVDNSIKWATNPVFVAFSKSYLLKGNPVLADLNNDGILEIAVSVFYDDSCNFDVCTDKFTELFIYNSNGTKLFSKCEIGFGGCNDGSSTRSTWEGTNPFVLDYDKNGIDDICFVKDKKSGGYFENMSLNCYNYSGNEIANRYLTNIEDGIRGAAITADMNNDGEKEIITVFDIYLLNGTSIFSYNLDPVNPIAVDLDSNKGLDLIWTKGNSTKVFLDSNNYTIDLAVFESDISFFKFNQSHINVSAIIRNTGQIEVKNVKIVVYNAETLESKNAVANIKKDLTFSSILPLEPNQEVFVSVDYNNEINESDEENNAAFKEFIGLPYVFVSGEGSQNVNSEFQEYIKNNLVSGYYTTNELEADVDVYIGKNIPKNTVKNKEFLDKFSVGYDFGSIIYNEENGLNPYSGLVVSFKEGSLFGSIPVHIMIVGNEVEGEISAVKEFIKNQALFLNVKDKHVLFIDDENPEAIKIYDYLHLGGNSEHYNLDNGQFRIIVRNALNDQMFTVEDKTVDADGVSLRLRNLKPNISSDYLEYLDSSGIPVEMPVVLAHGLFSNLTTWETLGGELANIGRDTWLIEITGGPGQDCDDCIDYTFDDLTDSYVPALLNGVLDFTNKDNLQYVGFSNGCRSALDSLERGMFDSDKVETFVAVGCPGAFEGNSTLGGVIASRNRDISKNLNSKNINHPSLNQIIRNGLFDQNYLSNNYETKISLNLYKFWEEIIINKTDIQPGNIEIPNFVIIQGSALVVEDGLITVNDEKSIYQNVNDTNLKQHFDVFAIHSGLDNNNRAKSIIKKSINKQELSFYEKAINLINQSN